MLRSDETYDFIKDENGAWLIDLPEYIAAGGSKEDLYMVAGADLFLDFLSPNNDKITIRFTDKEFTNANKLHLIQLGRPDGFEFGTGAWYQLNTFKGQSHFQPMWLCDVVKYIFNDSFPFTIYFEIK